MAWVIAMPCTLKINIVVANPVGQKTQQGLTFGEHKPTTAHVGGSFGDRCIKGLIIAKLAHNHKYEYLIETYDEMIKKTMNDESIERYQKVKEYLWITKQAQPVPRLRSFLTIPFQY